MIDNNIAYSGAQIDLKMHIFLLVCHFSDSAPGKIPHLFALKRTTVLFPINHILDILVGLFGVHITEGHFDYDAFELLFGHFEVVDSKTICML